MESLNEPLLSPEDSQHGGSNELIEGSTDHEQEREHTGHDGEEAAPSCIWRIIQPVIAILHRPVIPEMEGDLKVQVRFLKFLAVTFLGIVTTRMIIFSLVRQLLVYASLAL